MTQTLATRSDAVHLERTLELARRGRGHTSPNPLVGAVVTRDGRTLGEGFHAGPGLPHAEPAAIAACDEDPGGATIYVSLEPCAHRGRTPPCTDAILAAGIRRVVIASDDPTPKAAGRGPELLRAEGVEVEWADEETARAARLLNQPFRKHALTGRPLVVLKSALTLDGKVATRTGDSKWISGDASRARVHEWRGELDAVVVGIGTALADDPLLTARPDGGARADRLGPDIGAAAAGDRLGPDIGAAAAGDRLGPDDGAVAPRGRPARVVFDSRARLPLASALVRTAGEAPVILVCSPAAPRTAREVLAAAGVEVLVARAADEPARVREALALLGERGIQSLLLEGGPRLAGAFLDAGEIDAMRAFVAPMLAGGGAARGVLDGRGAETVADARRALAVEVERIGDETLITSRFREW